jgi:hypothetical protein
MAFELPVVEDSAEIRVSLENGCRTGRKPHARPSWPNPTDGSRWRPRWRGRQPVSDLDQHILFPVAQGVYHKKPSHLFNRIVQVINSSDIEEQSKVKGRVIFEAGKRWFELFRLHREQPQPPDSPHRQHPETRPAIILEPSYSYQSRIPLKSFWRSLSTVSPLIRSESSSVHRAPPPAGAGIPEI